MTTQNIALFQGIEAKMKYLDMRQRILAQNVANADTPGYRPNDVTAPDFSTILQAGSGDKLRPVTDNPMHLPSIKAATDSKSKAQRVMYDIKPSGNSINLEEQMVKESQNGMDFNLMTSLYQKSVSMMRTAIGAS